MAEAKHHYSEGCPASPNSEPQSFTMDLTDINVGSYLPTFQRICTGGRPPDIGSLDNPCWGRSPGMLYSGNTRREIITNL